MNKDYAIKIVANWLKDYNNDVVVKVMEIDNQGRINLSRKDALADIEAKKQ